jgi:hypothetical protein
MDNPRDRGSKETGRAEQTIYPKISAEKRDEVVDNRDEVEAPKPVPGESEAHAPPESQHAPGQETSRERCWFARFRRKPKREKRTALEMSDPPIRPDRTELISYSAHQAVAAQATAFLTYIITTATLYTTVTFAAWGLVLGNTFTASPVARVWLLGLHVLLSFGTAAGIWGVSNNFIQRLNLARWLGALFWPNIENMGGPEISWKGVPGVPENGTLQVLEFSKWRDDRRKKNIRPSSRLDFWLRYRALGWPSLRYQRVWALLPFFAGVVSVVFMYQIGQGAAGQQHQLICDQVALTLSFPDNAPVPSQVFDRARYLFDKTGCELSHIHLRPPRG